MNFNDGSENRNLNSAKLPSQPSAESLDTNEDSVPGAGSEKSQEHVDQVAMESATRAQHRIHNDEQVTPGSTLFTK